jgi:hypothetical protein
VSSGVTSERCVPSVTGVRLRVLPSVMNDLLKEAEEIFKQHGECERRFVSSQIAASGT